MRLSALVLALGEMAALGARTLPIRHFNANIVPLSITQDREGLLWLAAPGGVWRFDGLHFEAVEAPTGIDLSGARQVAAAPDGSIWIGTMSGLWRYRDGQFTKALPGRIEALAVTRTGRILTMADGRTELDICLEWTGNSCHWSRLPNVWVTGGFHEDLDGKTWFGAGSYICAWSDADLAAAVPDPGWVRSHLMQTFAAPTDPPKMLGLSDVVATPDGRVWARNGPDIVRMKDGRAVSRTSLPVETYNGMRPAFFLDGRGRLWIPGRQLSVVENGALQPFTSSPALENVTAVFEDRQKTLWFGLAGKGLAAVPDDASLESWAAPEGISGSVLDLVAHPRLGMVAATDAGGLILDAGARHWEAAAPPAGRMALRSVAVGSDAALLYLPYSGGLLVSAPPSLTTRAAPLPAAMATKYRKLYRDSQGAIWIADLNGLFHLDQAGHIQRIPLPGKGTHASDIREDSSGQVWVGYEGGVARCQGMTCAAVILPANGMINPKVRTIAPAPGEIWVGYRGGPGFSRFRQQQGGWVATQFRPAGGYGPVDTHFLRRDRRGWIWRGSTDGVYVSDGKHTAPEDWIHLTFGEGINASYANMYGFLETPDGSVWIGTQAGVVRLHPAADWFALAPPRLQPVVSGRGREEMAFHLAQPGLPPFQSRLFRYRLRPVDTAWRFSADGTVRYPKLRAGKYRFELAAGQDRPLEEYTFRVETHPGIWWPVGMALALGAAAGLVVAVARRRRSIGKTSEAAGYWEEKRRFLEAREAGEGSEATPPEDWSGRLLADRFRLQQLLASGGFAAVYRARDEEGANETVAVKLLHPLRDHAAWRRRRFAEEVAALRKLNHPGIVSIRSAGETALDRPYLVMEFIDGLTLREVLARGPLEPERASRLLTRIGEALAAAHRSGVLHRDLKPENVMISAAGSPAECVKLIDFGIASSLSQESSDHTTQLAGSPGYLAPERWVGIATCASDIYSLAAIAAEMIAGTSIADLRSSETDLSSVEERIHALCPAVPQAAIDLLASALRYDPADRPRDAEVFAHEFAAHLAGALRTVKTNG